MYLLNTHIPRVSPLPGTCIYGDQSLTKPRTLSQLSKSTHAGARFSGGGVGVEPSPEQQMETSQVWGGKREP